MSAMTALSSPSSGGGLSEFPFFEGFTEAELSRAGLHASPRALQPGEDLFTEGEPRSRTWFLRSGWVRMRVHSKGGHEATAVILGPGELCAAAPLSSQSYACTITALTEAEASGVPAHSFEALLKTDARAALRMAECMAARVQEIAQLKAINGERAALRLTLTLAWLCRKIGPRLPATRALLADLTGLRAETCSRALSGLRRKGIVRVSPRVVHVLQPAKLEALATKK
jgi:CRP/FNR family transcriptional regulator, anaerobic regulatory protein